MIPPDFSSPYHVHPELLVYLRLQKVFPIQSFALVLRHYLCSGQLKLALEYHIQYILILFLLTIFVTIIMGRKRFKRFVTLSLTALAGKRNPSIVFKVVATFYHEVPNSTVLNSKPAQ